MERRRRTGPRALVAAPDAWGDAEQARAWLGPHAFGVGVREHALHWRFAGGARTWITESEDAAPAVVAARAAIGDERWRAVRDELEAAATASGRTEPDGAFVVEPRHVVVLDARPGSHVQLRLGSRDGRPGASRPAAVSAPGRRRAVSGAARVPPAAGLLEREQEVTRVLALLDAAVAGRGSGVVIEGPPGIGKTALLTAAIAAAREQRVRVLRARGAETARELPFGAVHELLGAAVRDAPEHERRTLLEGVAGVAEPLLLDAAAPAGTTGSVDPLVHALFWVVAGLAEEGPLLLVVDDVQWADAPSLRFLRHLARRIGELPVLLALAARTGEPQRSGDALAALGVEAAVTHVAPAPLSTAGVAQLVVERLGAAPDDAFARACGEASAGNPFLVHELLQELARAGGRPVAAEVARIAAARPASVRRAVLVRLARLPPACAAVAHAVAVLERAPFAVVAELAGLDGPTADAAVDRLVAADVLSADDELAFRHPVLRAVVYDDLPPRERGRRHAEAARLLARFGADAERAAVHLRSTDLPLDAGDVALLRRAADRALARGAPEQAAAFLRRAIAPGAPPPDFGCLLQLGTAEALAIRPAAAEVLERAVAAAPDPRAAAQALQLLAVAQNGMAQIEAAAATLERAIDVLGDADRELLLRLESRLGALRLLALGQATTGRLDRYGGLRGETPGERLVLATIAARDAMRGEQWTFVVDALRRALGGGELLDDPDAEVIGAAVVQAVFLGEDFATGDQLVSRVRATALRHGSAAGTVLSGCLAGFAEMFRGDLRRAEEELEPVLALAEELGTALAVIVVDFLVQVLVEQGAHDRAQAVLTRAGLDGPLPPGPAWADCVLLARALLRLAQGRAEDALADATDLGRRQARLGHVHISRVNGWRPAAIRALVALGEHDRALDLAEELLELATARGLDRPIGVALHHLGLALPGDEGLDRLTEAVAVLRRAPAPFERAEALLALGSALRRARRPAEARGPLQEAADLGERCGAAGVAACAVEELAATGMRRRRAVSDRDELTASERRIAAMAAEGMTNKRIAQALFVTCKTVESHLGSAYRKLGIRSRHELPAALTVAGRDPAAA